MLRAVKHRLGAQHLDLGARTQGFNLSLESIALVNLREYCGNDETLRLHYADEFVEGLGTDVAGGESADAGDDVVSGVGRRDRVGEVYGCEVAVYAGLASDLKHAWAQVDAVDLLGTKLGEAEAKEAMSAVDHSCSLSRGEHIRDTDKASTTSGVENLNGWIDDATLGRDQGVGDGLSDKWRSLVLFAFKDVSVIASSPVVIQLGHVLNVKLAIGALEVRVVARDVVVVSTGRRDGGHGEGSLVRWKVAALDGCR